MGVIEWKSCYEIGVGTFDAEHHALVGIINELYEALRQKRGDDCLGELFERLVEYTEKHFSHEEQWMEKYQYPQRLEHQQHHQQLTATLRNFQQQLGTQPDLPQDVFRFLRSWLLNHIVKTDKAMGAYLRQHSVYDCGPPHV